MRWLLALCVMLWPLGAVADPSEVLADAAGQLSAAAEALEAAEDASDRIGALATTVRAYEVGLAALRDGLRQLALQEKVLTDDLATEEVRLSRLLAALQRLGAAPAEALLLHPNGAVGTARAGILLSSVAPTLEDEVRGLRLQLDDLKALRVTQTAALENLSTGLAGASAARAALAEAVDAREDLPMRFAADRAALQRLLDSARSLDEFAVGLLVSVSRSDLPAGGDFAGAQGILPLPVAGTLLRRFDEVDAAGIRRPGLILATRPRALVTAPWPATLRYRGPLLDYGTVVILETGQDFLMVFAGLSEAYGVIGEIVPAGAPVGLMGGDLPQVQAILTEARDGGGVSLSETLYIEVRENGVPVDPGPWFAEIED